MADPYAQFADAKADPYAQFADAQPEGGDQPAVRRYQVKFGAQTVTFDAPSDTSDDDVRKLAHAAALKAGVKNPNTHSSPVVPLGTATDHSWLSGFASGVIKPLDNLATAASHIPYVGPAVDRIGVALGLPSTADAVAAHDEARANNDRTSGQVIGNIAGTAPTMALPGGALVQGGAAGALLTDKKDPVGIATATGTAALTGFGTGKLMSGLGSIASPVVSKAARALNEAGIPLTLGQLAKTGSGLGSKVIAGVEAGARRLPFIKNLVLNAEDRGVVANYKAVIARTGVKVPDSIAPGHETTDYVGEQLSKKYEALLPQLRVAADDKLASGLASIERDLKAIAPASTFSQFQSILEHAGLQGKATSIDGKSFQHADRVLRTQAAKFGKSLDPNQQEMGAAFDAVRQQLRGMLLRQNPGHAEELSALNRSWRELAIARKAAGDPNKGTGLFTPAKYATAAKGSRSNQELTRAADQILPNRSPDSGTAEGVALGQLLVGGAGYGAAHVNPLAALPAAGSLLYTRPGQALLNKAFFATRPGAVRATGTALKKLSKLAPAAVQVVSAANGQ